MALLWILSPVLAAAVTGSCPPATPDRTIGRPTPRDASAPLDGLRVPFVSNDGQLDPRVAYYVPTPGAAFFVTRKGELVYSLRDRGQGQESRAAADGRREWFERRRGNRPRSLGRGWSLTETLVGGRTRPAGQDRGVATVSDFRRSDPAGWRAALATYQAVGLGEVWPGITVALQATGGRVEKIFTVAPGASADPIRVHVRGARSLSVDAGGALVAHTGLGDVTFTPPVAFQQRGGVRQSVSVAYRLDGRRQYGFAVGAYDPALPLVIDPLLQSTFLGGNDDDIAHAMAIHPTTGDVYVTGETFSENFPGTEGGAIPLLNAALEGWVARLDSTLTVFFNATYFGGDGFDSPSAIVIHPETNDVYVAGITDSDDLPGTTGAAQTERAGLDDAFVARFSGDLTMLFRATYLGGSNTDGADALAINRNPTTNQLEVYVGGTTASDDFPEANNALDTGVGVDAFVTRLSADLGTRLQSRYLGGTGEDSAYALGFHPTTGAVYVAGQTFSDDFPGVTGGVQEMFGGGCLCSGDAFVALLNSDLTTLSQATYLGGDDDDIGNALVVHPVTADVYVAGGTFSTDFPVASGAQEGLAGLQNAFVARLNSGLTPTDFRATYLGGGALDEAFGLALHPITGEVYVAGGTLSGSEGTDPFPFTAGGVQPDFGGCLSDMFISRLSPDLASILQSTYLGAGGFDAAYALAISPLTGEVYVAGETEGPFPGTLGGARPTFGGGFNDGVVARLSRPLTATEPDLTTLKSHVGNFLTGQVGAAYTITVINVGGAATDGTTVTVTDTLPAALTATGLGGAGWTCVLGTLTCTRADALAPGSSYPPITLTVNVAAAAPASVTNTATVSGGGDVTAGNNTASDSTTIVSAPDLTITKTHAGNLSQGQVGATYTITVANTGSLATDGTQVTVVDTLPAGLTAVALGGTGWGCTLATLTCTRSDVLGVGASYPVITLTVDVAANASSPLTNTATVSGGGDANPANNTASDPTIVVGKADLTILKSHIGVFLSGQVGAAYTITVVNVGGAASDGTTVTVTDTLPGVLTATALEGSGWTCVLGTLTCTRADALGAGSSYPPVTLTVNVSASASSPVINTVTVSGGGDVTPGNNTANDPTTFSQGHFVDVPAEHPFFQYVEALVAAGITGGCAIDPPSYCPDAPLPRGQMAVLVLRGIHGGAHEPPAATGMVFDDVPLGLSLAAWIEQFFQEGITGGCSASPPLYCPNGGVTRAQIAVFLLRAKHGAGYQPPPAQGLFVDVPIDHPLAAFIEQLANEAITTGCGPTTYCPDSVVTRGQIAVFLVRTFNL